jgi:hypothetical protein
MREYLNLFCDANSEVGVEEVAIKFPGCACESAYSPVGSHGPVANHELLRYFLASTSDIDASKPTHRKKRAFRVQSLGRAYKNGLSVCRLDYSDRSELELTAKMLYDHQVGQTGEFGGILGVVDFPASAVRCTLDGSDAIPLCVLETPLDQNGADGFDRPSHADLVNSQANLTDEDRIASRSIIYNQIKAQGNQTDPEFVTDCNLVQFLPSLIIGSLQG